MALSSGRLVMSIISPPGGKGVPDYSKIKLAVPLHPSSLQGDLLHLSPGAPSLVPLNWTSCSMEPVGFALLVGDASWFREIHVPRVWRIYLATGFDFREKEVVLVLVR